jgi:hypothetical protein
MQRILSAEKFSTISSQVNEAIRPDHEALATAWREMLVIDEHSWQADRSVTDPESLQSQRQGETKDARATVARLSIEYTLGRALSAICDSINRPKGTLVVFNPLSWKRDGLVEVDIDKNTAVVDLSTQKTVSCELVTAGNSYQRIRFLARDVPPIGYKSFALQPGSPAPLGSAIERESSMENSFYRITFDAGTGSVRSIIDKQLQRELIDQTSPYRFDQYLYVTGADSLPNRLVQYSTVSPVPELKIHPAQSGRIVSISKLPFGTVARLESSSTNTPLVRSEVVLFDHQKRIEFTNWVQKEKTYSKEAVYFAFPFAMDPARFRYGIQNGFVDPARDQLPGAGKEWFTVQHWVSVEHDEFAAALVPVNAPLITLGDIARGNWPVEFGKRRGTVFSYVMNNYTPEGYLAGQGGPFLFRYALTSGEQLDLIALARLGWEAMSPLEINEIRHNDKPLAMKGRLEGAEGSFLQVDPGNVIATTWKIAENSDGTILRLLEVGGKSSEATIVTPGLPLKEAWLCNAVEANLKSLKVDNESLRFEIKPFEIVTLRLKGAR